MRCTKCGNKARGNLRSPLGELVCESCYTKVMGMVVGGAAAGIGGAVAGPGILGWIRGALKGGPRKPVKDEIAETPTRTEPET